MRIGIFSTFDVKCGIASYTKQLADELDALGHDLTIFCNYNLNNHKDVDFGVEYETYPCYEWYGETNKKSWDINSELLESFDVLHIQYESWLWAEDYFRNIPAEVPIVVTFHSSCISPAFIQYINSIENQVVCLTHHNVGCPGFNVRRIPMPILRQTEVEIPFAAKKNRLFSFGLGRNNDKFCLEALSILKDKFGVEVEYVTEYSTRNKWYSDEELGHMINDSKFVALMYPATGAEVSSSAVCRALTYKSLVFVSNTKWFEHVAGNDNVKGVDTPEKMAEHMGLAFAYNSIADYSNSVLPEGQEYTPPVSTMTEFVDKHLEIYQEVADD